MSFEMVDLHLYPANEAKVSLLELHSQDRIKGSVLREIIESFHEYAKVNGLMSEGPVVVTRIDKTQAVPTKVAVLDGEPSEQTPTPAPEVRAVVYQANIHPHAIVFHKI